MCDNSAGFVCVIIICMCMCYRIYICMCVCVVCVSQSHCAAEHVLHGISNLYYTNKLLVIDVFLSNRYQY